MPDKPQPPKPKQSNLVRMQLLAWPDKRRSQGIGISIRDGWNFAIGFSFALTIAVPIIVLAGVILLAVLGVGLGSLVP